MTNFSRVFWTSEPPADDDDDDDEAAKRTVSIHQGAAKSFCETFQSVTIQGSIPLGLSDQNKTKRSFRALNSCRVTWQTKDWRRRFPWGQQWHNCTLCLFISLHVHSKDRCLCTRGALPDITYLLFIHIEENYETLIICLLHESVSEKYALFFFSLLLSSTLLYSNEIISISSFPWPAFPSLHRATRLFLLWFQATDWLFFHN